MRTKLFIAFFLVISLALLSNFIFEHYIILDFEEYVRGTREDHLYWLLASVEGSYDPAEGPDGGWNLSSLRNTLHWALMLRFECVVTDSTGRKLLDTEDLYRRMSEEMKGRMRILEPPSGKRIPFETYPLFSHEKEIGTFLVRDIRDLNSPIMQKEMIFMERGRRFLLISFLIAGGGAVFLALVFSQFLSKPVLELKGASEAVAKGDLSVRLRAGRDEIGRLKGAFNRMAEALEKEDSVRRQLTANVAHELRTPLAVMRARIEAMQDGIIEADGAALEGLRAEIDSLTKLIAGIEDLTKAEASFFRKSTPEKVDLREFLDGIAEGMRPLYADKGLDLSIEGGDRLKVYTEPEKLEKILRNILSNALGHSEKGGVRISYGRDEDMFFVGVRDTGKGIPAEELPHIFDRFYRGKSSKGFGLGLAIVKELAEIMGGSVRAESAPGKGSTFTVRLPREKEQ
jgi:two-component system sensor histidine kinase BaeS